MAAVCVLDFDCKDNELCYANTTHFDELLARNDSNSNRLLGCDCNAWYGWKGSNCDEFSFETFFFFFLAFILSLMSFATFVIASKNFRSQLKQMRSWNSRVTTTLFLSLGSFGIFLWAIILAISHFTTGGGFVGSSNVVEADPYKNRLNLIGFIGGGVGPVFIGAASINVCFVWLEVARQIRSPSHFTVSQLKRYKWVLYSFFVLGVLVLVLSQVAQRGGSANQNPNILGFTLLPLALALIFMFSFASRKITLVLQEFSNPVSGEVDANSGLRRASVLSQMDPQLEHEIRNIRETSRIASVCFSFFIASLFIFSIIDVQGVNANGGLGWRNSVHPGSTFPFAKIIYYVTLASLTVMGGNLARYSYQEYTGKKVALPKFTSGANNTTPQLGANTGSKEV